MRVAFISDVIQTPRSPTTVARHPLVSFLRPHPHFSLAPPSANDSLYAGIAELTTAQLQALRDEATTRGIRFFAVPLADRLDATPIGTADRSAVSTFCAELGIAVPDASETRSAFLGRVVQRLAGKTLAELFDRVARKASA